MKILTGTAYVCIKDQRHPVALTVDLFKGEMVIKGGDMSLAFRAFLQLKLSLNEINIPTPLGTLEANLVNNFIVISAKGGKGHHYSAINDANLLHIVKSDLNLADEDEFAIKVMPNPALLEMSMQAGFICDKTRQVIFYAPKLPKQKLKLSCFNNGMSLESFEEYISVTIDKDLNHSTETIQTALEILFRHKITRLIEVTNQQKVVLNLSGVDQTLSIGHMVDIHQYPDVFERLVEGVGNTKDSSQFYFFVQSFSNPAALEVRLINAFTYVEMIIGAKTITDAALRSLFRIGAGDAKLINSIRNSIIHEGMSLVEALKKAKRDIQNSISNDAGIIEEIISQEKPHGCFYAAFMDLLTRHLMGSFNISTSDQRHVLKGLKFKTVN